MADSISYDDSELQELLKKAGVVFLEGTSAYTTILEKAGRKVGAKAEELAGSYPPAPRRPLSAYYQRTHINTTDQPRSTDGQPYLSKFKSQAQQGYYFANLADGGLTVPYKRTGYLGASITSEAEVTQGGVIVEVGSPLGYAPLVIGGPDEQSFYHTETGWRSLGDQLDEASDVLLNTFVDGVVEGVEAYLLG